MNAMKWFKERAEESVVMAREAIEQAKEEDMFGSVQLVDAPIFFDDESWSIDREDPDNRMWQWLLAERMDSGDNRGLEMAAKMMQARFITNEPVFNLARCLLLSDALDNLQDGMSVLEGEAVLEEAMELFQPTGRK
jgi:hypothetical protein